MRLAVTGFWHIEYTTVSLTGSAVLGGILLVVCRAIREAQIHQTKVSHVQGKRSTRCAIMKQKLNSSKFELVVKKNCIVVVQEKVSFFRYVDLLFSYNLMFLIVALSSRCSSICSSGH